MLCALARPDLSHAGRELGLSSGVVGDAQLVVALRDGDKDAGECLVDRYYDRVQRFFQNKAPSAVHELTQRTFLSCVENLGRLRDPEMFRAFLFGIACHQLRKHHRRSRSDGEGLDFDTVCAVELDPSPSGVSAQREEQHILLAGLRRVPVEYQIALELGYWEGMTAAEVAEILAMPTSDVEARVQKGRQLLEGAIAEAGEGPARESTLGDLDGWARSLREA
jgi:RNA polymerase sigma factor (sigma-70 family)